MPDDDTDSPGVDMPDVDFGGSATFDFDGNFHGAELHAQVPGAAEDSDPAQWDFEPDSDSAADPQAAPWMPHITEPGAPEFDPTDIMHAPVPDGWERDNLGILHPDLGDLGDLDGAGTSEAPDFQLEMPQPENPYAPHLDVPQLHLDLDADAFAMDADTGSDE